MLASHDMKPFMQTIKLQLKQVIIVLKKTQTAATDPVIKKVIKSCCLIESQLRLLGSSINDIFDMCLIREGNFRLLSNSFDLNKVLETVYRTLKYSALHRKLKLTYETSISGVESQQSGAFESQQKHQNKRSSSSILMPKLLGDRRRLKQAILMLGNNAIKQFASSQSASITKAKFSTT